MSQSFTVSVPAPYEIVDPPGLGIDNLSPVQVMFCLFVLSIRLAATSGERGKLFRVANNFNQTSSADKRYKLRLVAMFHANSPSTHRLDVNADRGQTVALAGLRLVRDPKAADFIEQTFVFGGLSDFKSNTVIRT